MINKKKTKKVLRSIHNIVIFYIAKGEGFGKTKGIIGNNSGIFVPYGLLCW